MRHTRALLADLLDKGFVREIEMRGVCSFCGRALCKEHMKKMPELY